MIQIPSDIKIKFDAVLVKKTIPGRSRSDYSKWLRYYLDFCHKYRFDQLNKESLTYFVKKLQDKNQTAQQQKQAVHAVSIYYEVSQSGSQKKTIAGTNIEVSSTNNGDLKLTNASWKSAYNDLNSEIKIRHYSPKTLKAYTGWAGQFQAFTRSKDPQLLAASDVKDFLTFLAVKRKVSASSQNQAFNALLFFFRHVIKNEFGELKDVVRAKRKPYIPVVLSREEIEAIITNLSYPYDLIVKLLYGCGLRISECMNLRIHNFNFDTGVLTVHDGKGKKDRTVPLPETIIPELKTHLEVVINLHGSDLDSGYAGAFLVGLLEKKYKNAA
ncbi:MAG: phage integrase N-terminal SAM-like domain-containing protein, partial [Acidobacteriota bacterium]|nr:phage integrase N-terminal SAM-like domain-containing protein [Acidobacteriota bacterium]